MVAAAAFQGEASTGRLSIEGDVGSGGENSGEHMRRKNKREKTGEWVLGQIRDAASFFIFRHCSTSEKIRGKYSFKR